MAPARNLKSSQNSKNSLVLIFIELLATPQSKAQTQLQDQALTTRPKAIAFGKAAGARSYNACKGESSTGMGDILGISRDRAGGWERVRLISKGIETAPALPADIADVIVADHNFFQSAMLTSSLLITASSNRNADVTVAHLASSKLQQPSTPLSHPSWVMCPDARVDSVRGRLVTHAMSLFDFQDVCMVVGSQATLDLPMVVDLIGIFELKGPYCTLTMTDWFLQALSVIPRGSWDDVARRFSMIRWVVRKCGFGVTNVVSPRLAVSLNH
ncbi:nuclear cap-binding protein subunit 1 [Dorcoceras hygrometricum]|uniref:Nuclear cap-binding protein subunit 1 n=1 Tax=Dorcoceras hygrometricum TaxID=472368 RepID=A0A2Z7ANS5_9LAMI|nr:nuclear cap-binding protein subunit 1 [Dorcoceras hygrometricum]